MIHETQLKDSLEILKKDGFYIVANIPGIQAQTAGNYDIFFQPNRACEITEIRIRHSVAGTDGGNVTLNIERINNGSAKDSGVTILKTNYNLKGAANSQTIYSGRLEIQNNYIKPTQVLALKDSGVLATLEGVSVTIYFKYSDRGDYL